MRISKKILAIALSILMAVSMMPFTVFAAGSETQLESSKASVTVKVEDVSVTTYYDSFEEALAACPENATDVATIKLLDDITVTSTVMINNGKNIKLNTNSKTMTSANVDPMFRIEGGKLETSGKGTIQSTTNDCTVFRVVGKKDAEAQWSKLLIGGSNTGNGNCTTVISKEYGVLIPSTNNYADGVYVEVKGIVQSGVSAIYTNGNINKYGANPAQIVLQNASSPKLICTDDKNNAVHDNVAVYAAGYAEWTFKTGSVTGPTALWAKSGKFNLAGTSFKGNGEEVAYSHNGNGITATGEAVVFENCAGYLNELDVTISKGTFNSVNADPIGTYAYSKGTDTREEIDEFVSGGAFQNNGVAADVSEYYTDELAEKFATGNAYIESNIFSLDVDGRINASAPGAKIVRDGKDYYCGNVIKAANNSVSGDTVVALTDYSTGSQVVISNPDVTIDLGGHTFTSTNSLYPIRVQDGASATFTNGTITNPNGISMVGDSSLVIADDCVVNGNISNYDTVSSSNATVDIYGTVNGTVAPKTAGTEVNIYEGAEITAASAINAKAGTTVNVYGGTVSGTVAETGTGEVNISGGTFDTDVTAYVNEGASQDPVTGVVTQDYVAKIGNVMYNTFEAAWNAAVDGDTITLVADSAGNGLQAPQGTYTQGLTVDFNGFTYTIDGTLVGSPSTQSQAFQLLKDNKITFKNGTIYSEKARMLVQNYSDLTLDNMTLTLNNTTTAPSTVYTLSNNNGDVVIKDTTINANPVNTAFAFDVCRYSSYTSVNVTVTGDSEINGDVEISASKSDPKDGFSLTLESGELNGDIVIDATAENVLETTPAKAEITKAAAFTQAAPEGYAWLDNGDNTYTLGRVAADEVSITTADRIEVNVYLDDTSEEKTVEYTFNASPNVQADNQETVTVDFASLPTVDGKKQLTIVVAPAQIRDNIDIDVKDAAGYVVRSYENYSVFAYCDEIIAGDYTDAVKTLAKSVLDYGKAASAFFGYNENAFANQTYYFNDFTFDTTGFTATKSDNIIIDEVRYVATSVPSLRFVVDMAEAEAEALTATTDKGYTAKFIKVEDDVVLQVKGIPASKLGETITITLKDQNKDVVGTIEYTPLVFAYMATKDSTTPGFARLGETIGQYSAAANAVFG